MVSHYKILEKLGGGGMGEVYKAEDIKLKRTVALKFLPIYFSSDEEAKKRFIQEAQNASSLDHPNICTIYEIDETKDFPDKAIGRLFIAMAYYEGETLKKKIRPRLMNQSYMIEIAIQVAKGLAKAHQQGIIHRDIKPANIMITRDSVAKIVDFGLARLATKSEITRPEITMGTLSHISPEQIQGKKIDQRTDIWSFGVMLYEMLTGELPFKGDIDQAIIYSILNEGPEPFRFAISQQLQRIIYKTLEKNPDNRYQSMEIIISDLKSIEKEGKVLKAEKVKPSIAVLPFKNMSKDESQEYFCEGMAEEIINALTTVKGLRVVARTSSFSFKGKDLDIREVGRKLNVEMILEGSVRKSDSRLRITAQLINVADGYHLWSDKFDRTLKDVFEIQDEISFSIVDKLKIKLLEKEKTKLTKRHTENLEAYDFYLLGRFFQSKSSKQDLEKAIELYNRALEKDNKFSRACAGIVASYGMMSTYMHFSDELMIAKAREAAETAVKIDPDSAAAHLSMGTYYLEFTWKWEMAKKELDKVVEIDPDYFLVHAVISGYYCFTGDLEQAVAEEKIVLEQDPLRVDSTIRIGIYSLRARKIKEAREKFLRAKEIESEYFFCYWMIGQTYMLDKEYDKGIELIKKALELSNEHPPVLTALGWAYATSGNIKEANKILTRLKERSKKEYMKPFFFVIIYSALNQIDEAFKWLEKSYNERDPAIHHILTVETIDNLRSDPRYIEVLKKMDLYNYYKQNI